MDKIQLQAAKREITGKKTKNLRKQGEIPAVVFGSDQDSINIQLNHKAFSKAYEKAGHSTLLDINLDGKDFKVLIDEVQYNPRNREIMHVMLNKVNLKEEIHAEVPIELVGEADGVKVEKGVLVTPVSTIEVKCLPTDLPPVIEVDISGLAQIGDSLTIGSISLPQGVKLLHEEDTEQIIATIAGAQKEEPVEEAAVSPDEIPSSSAKGSEEKTDEAAS